MGFIVAVSAFIIPLIIFYVVVDGIIHQTDVYDVFVEGAKDGMKTVVSILPTLIGLMMAVGILRASGFLAWISTDRPVWDSLTDDSSDYRQNVQFFGGNGVITGFVPGIWNGFLHRTDYIHYDELYRNDILYNVGLFSGGKGAKDAVDACGSTCIDSSGNCSKCFSGTPDELKIKNGGLQENEKISGRISRHIYPDIYGMRGSLIHGWICGVSRCCRHCADSRFYGGGAVIRFWHGIGSTL